MQMTPLDAVLHCSCLTEPAISPYKSSVKNLRENANVAGVDLKMRCHKLPGRIGPSTFSGFPVSPMPVSRSNRHRIPRCTKLNIFCESGMAKIKLKLNHQVKFGEHHALIGSAGCMGHWKDKVMMQWTDSGWVAEVEVNCSDKIEYKYVLVTKDGDLVWENGSNRVLKVPQTGNYEVVSHWDKTGEHLDLVVAENGSAFTVDKASSPVEKDNPNGSASNTSTTDVLNGTSSFVQEWQGRDVQFMKSNTHPRDQGGQWNTEGLEGPALHIAEGEKNARNWWRKLDVVRGLLMGDVGKANRLEALLNSAVYLKWINTGQIQCYEDGGHYRPNKHAGISQLIFRELERIYSQKDVTPKELMVIRRIHPCLPSFKDEFTASVPLTRIRDIAHRNDIPHDLKQEIKHTIQNKLHRNAGPEDLVATELLLARVTKNSDQYSGAFVEQLQIFYKELKDFFNAGSLTEQLEYLRAGFDESQASLLDNFLKQKADLDGLGQGEGGKNSANEMSFLIGTMHSLTSLRASLLKGLESGLRNDASDSAIAMRQKWRLCEIGLEDFYFVLQSRFINGLEREGGAGALCADAASQKTNIWNHSLGALILGVRHLGLSSWMQLECLAVDNEVQAWQAAGIVEKEVTEDGTRIWALRLKATIERARRLSEAYCDSLLQIYPESVEKLGKAFGIPENAIRTFTEAEVRASVVFQLSKLSSLLLKSLRAVLGSESLDPLVPGTAIGKLVEVDQITPGSLPSSVVGPIILLVKQADGDEEVKAAGSNVVGVILLQELPLLSHLGVRARQEKVVFVSCEDEEKEAEIRSMLGSTVRLEVQAENVHISKCNANEILKIGSTDEAKSHATQKPVHKAAAYEKKVVLSPEEFVFPVAKAEIEKAGAKASSCGSLALLSEQSKKVCSEHGVSAAFEVPLGMVIPFGSMETALESAGMASKFYSLVQKAETEEVSGGDLDHICRELQALIGSLRPPISVIDSIAKTMPENARLIVRSSANVEDLEGMSGAGLYESIPNVRASEPEVFGKAVAGVWASLYTRRAVLSRRAAGVPQVAAAMAVLVQELLSPQLSFVLHTVSPIDRDMSVVLAEVAPGLGETLASGTRGSPWRIAGNKFNGDVRTLSFANFSEELTVRNDSSADGNAGKQTVDYSKKRVSTDSRYRHQLAQRLATIGFFLEQKFQAPQDVEGCLVGEDIYIVQSRPQP